MEYNMKNKFDKEFLWGVATAAAQIEGGYIQDGKGLNIWDAFSHIPGNIANNDNCDIACDSYNRLDEDIKLLKELGVNSYRFSTSWSRILPKGKGVINEKGLNYYKKLVDKLLENNIKPNLTMYHWDLPYELERMGGWLNRDTAKYFADYAEIIFKNFGDKVSFISTFNEPIAIYVGYALKAFAPGYGLEKYGRQACHNAMLAHGLAVEKFRKYNFKETKIGIVIDIWNRVPFDENNQDDIRLANDENEGAHKFFLNMILNGKYSDYMLQKMKKENTLPYFKKEDFEIMSKPIDFFGLNCYNRIIVSSENRNIKEDISKRGGNFLNNGQEFYPKAVYDAAKILREEFKLKIPLFVTENGTFSNEEKEINGIIEDIDRVNYIKGFIEWIEKANKDGFDIRGYYVWSLMDNFEWTAGYNFKFGLYQTNFKTLERKPKRSAKEYAKIIKNNN